MRFPNGFYLLGFLFFVSGCSLFGSKENLSDEIIYDCKAIREYTTVLAYLREENLIKLADDRAREIAMVVTSGCTGAAQKFISVTNLLRKAGLDSKSAIELGIKLAKRYDAASETFVVVFKRTFASESLDLDLATSIRFARSLSLDFKGDPQQAGRDFEDILDYCIDEKLDLGRPVCGELAMRIVKATEMQAGEVAQSFKDAFEFLVEKDGPNLSTGDAIKIAEELVAISRFAPENFGKAYKFALSDTGLKLARAPAIDFARKVAKYTKYEGDEKKIERVRQNPSQKNHDRLSEGS